MEYILFIAISLIAFIIGCLIIYKKGVRDGYKECAKDGGMITGDDAKRFLEAVAKHEA